MKIELSDESEIRERLKTHIANKSSDILEDTFKINAAVFTDSEIFAKEIKLLRSLPMPLPAEGKLAKPHSFSSTELLGINLLQWSDENSTPHAYLNACRHRGAKLLEQTEGCASRAVCPYHSWVYDSSGALIRATHDDHAQTQKEKLGLIEFPTKKLHNLHWVILNPDDTTAFSELTALDQQFSGLGLGPAKSTMSYSLQSASNWKIGVASFLETYHFSTVHKNTLPNLQLQNINLLDFYGPHARIVVPLNPFLAATEKGEHGPLLSETNLQYFVFPNNFFLIFNGHYARISVWPLTENQSTWTYDAMVPENASDEVVERAQKSAQFLKQIQLEDIHIIDQTQKNLTSGLIKHLCGSVREGAIKHLHQHLQNRIVGVQYL